MRMRSPQSLIGNSECSYHLFGNVSYISANTTCKTHAFSAIEAIFGTKDWLFGNNTLTEGEVMLCEAYEQRGRSDLADCVRNGRKYQRLEYVIGNVILFLYAGGGSFGDATLLGMLNGLVDAFQGDKAGPLPETREPGSSGPCLNTAMTQDCPRLWYWKRPVLCIEPSGARTRIRYRTKTLQMTSKNLCP
jgi:hypothetical protein